MVEAAVLLARVHSDLLSIIRVSLISLVFESFYLIAGVGKAPKSAADMPEATDFLLAAITWLFGLILIFLTPCCAKALHAAWLRRLPMAARDAAMTLGLVICAWVPSKFLRVAVVCMHPPPPPSCPPP